MTTLAWVVWCLSHPLEFFFGRLVLYLLVVSAILAACGGDGESIGTSAASNQVCDTDPTER